MKEHVFFVRTCYSRDSSCYLHISCRLHSGWFHNIFSDMAILTSTESLDVIKASKNQKAFITKHSMSWRVDSDARIIIFIKCKLFYFACIKSLQNLTNHTNDLIFDTSLYRIPFKASLSTTGKLFLRFLSQFHISLPWLACINVILLARIIASKRQQQLLFPIHFWRQTHTQPEILRFQFFWKLFHIET